MIGDILQPTHLLFVLVIALLVLGPKRLPEVGRSLGRGLRDFRGAINGDDEPDPPLVTSHASVPAEPVAQPAPATQPMPAVTQSAPATQPMPAVAQPAAPAPPADTPS